MAPSILKALYEKDGVCRKETEKDSDILMDGTRSKGLGDRPQLHTTIDPLVVPQQPKA